MEDRVCSSRPRHPPGLAPIQYAGRSLGRVRTEDGRRRGEGRKREPRAKRGSLSSLPRRPSVSFPPHSEEREGRDARSLFLLPLLLLDTGLEAAAVVSEGRGTGACMATFTTLNLRAREGGREGLEYAAAEKETTNSPLFSPPPSRTYETFVCNAGSFFHSPLSRTGIRNLFQLPPSHFLLKTGEERTPPLAPPSVLHDHLLQLLKPQSSTMVPQKEKKYPAFYTTPPQ